MPEDLGDTVLCLFMAGLPGNADPNNRCWSDAAWHIRYEHRDGSGDMTSACEAHLGRALGWRPVMEFHEFGSACNTPESWWIPELGTCVSTETGLDLGFLQFIEEPVGRP